MARDVDEGDIDVADGDVREPEVDRDPAFLFFFEPIGIGTGERAHERALAVIDVARGSDDDRFHVKQIFFVSSCLRG